MSCISNKNKSECDEDTIFLDQFSLRQIKVTLITAMKIMNDDVQEHKANSLEQ